MRREERTERMWATRLETSFAVSTDAQENSGGCRQGGQRSGTLHYLTSPTTLPR